MKLKITAIFWMLFSWGAITYSQTPQTLPSSNLSLKIDALAGEIRIPAEVCLREGPLEFLLCRRGTKEHESILRTDVEGRAIHAALLSMGLRAGRPWRRSKDTGQELPPGGAPIAVELEWQDAHGQPQRGDAKDWLTLVRQESSGEKALPDYFVFAGSRTTETRFPGRPFFEEERNLQYGADSEGTLISLSNFENALLDVPFLSSQHNEELLFNARTKNIPPLNTPVTVILKILPEASSADQARAEVYIDAQGQLSTDDGLVEGDFTLDGYESPLWQWSQEYIRKHENGMITIVASPLAFAADIERVRASIYPGVREIEIQITGSIAPPRTERQVSAIAKEVSPMGGDSHAGRELRKRMALWLSQLEQWKKWTETLSQAPLESHQK